MTIVTLYLMLVTATLASFSGFGSLPQLRQDLVEHRQIVTDETLNRAVLIAHTIPGPMGVYIVTVGYEVGGLRGALAGWLALATPAVLVIGLCRAANSLMHDRRLRDAVSAVVLASAVLIVWTGLSLAQELFHKWTALLGLPLHQP